MPVTVTDQRVEDYQRDGVVLVKGLWTDWVEDDQSFASGTFDPPRQAWPGVPFGRP